MTYRIEYSPEAERHLRALSAHQPMRPNPIAPWELRRGHLRAYYDVVQQPDAVVFIRAVGVKVRHRVYIGKEVVP